MENPICNKKITGSHLKLKFSQKQNFRCLKIKNSPCIIQVFLNFTVLAFAIIISCERKDQKSIDVSGK